MFMKTPIVIISIMATLLSVNTFCAPDHPANDDGRTTFKCKSDRGAYTYQGKPCPAKSTTSDSWIWNVPRMPAQKNIQPKSYPSFSIQQSPQGSYMAQGAVNTVPVVFQVDTGADYVSIPQEIASKAGMICMKQSFAETANGTSLQCESRIVGMTFGTFNVPNVKAYILPNLKHPLLGMNVLGMFHVEHADRLMKVTYKH